MGIWVLKWLVSNLKLYDKSYFASYVKDAKREEMYRQEYERIENIAHLSCGNVLDIGCGLGDFLELFSDSWKKYGVEVSEYAKKTASKKGVNFKIPEKKNFFDLIVFRGTIQHLDTPLSEIKKKFEQLKPGGWMVFLATPNAGSWYYRIWQDLPMIDPKYNFVIFSDKQLSNILYQFGLKVKKINYPYIDSPYANPLLDHLKFVLKLLGFSMKFAFWKNMMEIYAQKPTTRNSLR